MATRTNYRRAQSQCDVFGHDPRCVTFVHARRYCTKCKRWLDKSISAIPQPVEDHWPERP